LSEQQQQSSTSKWCSNSAASISRYISKFAFLQIHH
jgi:hypothetical protein